jgi:hypothetical protein
MNSIFDDITSTEEAAEVEGIAEDVDSETLTTIDPNRTVEKLRDATKQLMASGLVEASGNASLYQTLLTSLLDVNRILEPLDLLARADDVRGLVYLTVLKSDDSEDDEWSHPLVRRQRLTLEQSLLVAILRQFFINFEQDSGIGRGEARVTVDELMSQLQVYLGDPGSEARERKRVVNMLEQLKGHGLVGTPDLHGRVEIRPVIAHVANPENLKALLSNMSALAEAKTTDDLSEES